MRHRGSAGTIVGAARPGGATALVRDVRAGGRTALGPIGLTLLATALEGVLAWCLLSADVAPAGWPVVVPLLGLVGAGAGVAVWAPVGAGARARSRARRASSVAVTLALPLGGLLGLVTLAGLTDAAVRLPGPGPVALWTCLGVAVVAVARCLRRSFAGHHPVRTDLLLPGLLLLAVLLAVAALGGPAYRAVYVYLPAAAIGFVGLVVVPTVLVGDAVAGLEQVQARALRVERLTLRRPALGLAVVVAKIAAAVVVGLVAARLQPGSSHLHASGKAWLAAVLLAGLGVSVLTVERRLGITTADHRALVRAPGLLTSAAFGVVVAGVALGLVASEAHKAPLVAGALLALLVGVVLLVHRGPDRFARWHHPVGAGAGALASLAVLGPTGTPLPGALAGSVAKPVVGGLLLAGAVVALGLLVVRVVRRGRLRLLAYAVALAGWTALVVLVQRRAQPWSLLTLDLAFGAVLLLAWLTWRLRLQRAVDGFEVVLAAVVTTSVLDTMVLLESLGASFSHGLLATTLVAPGVVACVRLWTPGAAADAARRRREVARVCTVYGLLLALVSVTGWQAASTIDQLGGLVAQLLTLPLALLLVAATSAARPPQGVPAANPVPA